MAVLRINPLGLPLVQNGTAADDLFRVATPAALLAPGLQQDALGGNDTLVLAMGGVTTLTDAHFVGLTGFETLALRISGTVALSLGSAAEAAFGPLMRITLPGTTAAFDLDASGIGTGTALLVAGRDADDTITGGAAADRLSGGGGADQIAGGGGHDTLLGGNGNDNLAGDAGSDSLAGGGDDDTLLGGAGNDRLNGDAGADRLDGGADDDVLFGGSGADVFVMRPGGGTDVINDFSLAEDRLDVSLLGLGTLTEALGFARQAGAGTVFTFTDGTTVTLRNVVLTNLDEADFVLAAGIATNDLTVSENLGAGARVGEWSPTGFAPVGALAWEVVTAGVPFAFLENRLVTTAPLDFEAASSFAITVRVTDAGTGRVVERNVTVTVEDAGDTNIVQTLDRSFIGADGALGGQAGESVSRTLFDAADSVTGTILPDEVTWTGSVTGGDGAGDRAGGGAGGSAEASVSSARLRLGVPEAISQDIATVAITADGGFGGSADADFGGAGGAASADITDWDSALTASMDLSLTAIARGGGGGSSASVAGQGGAAQASIAGVSTFGSSAMNMTLLASAVGGSGGDGADSPITGSIGLGAAGGGATASITGTSFGAFALDNAASLVRLEASATGGGGGIRGDGLVRAARGGATIILESNTIELQGGDDTLQIALFFDGATQTLTASGNDFSGGTGTDTLDLSAVFGGFGATVILQGGGFLSLGAGVVAFLSGFEHFIGTESADIFLEAAGSQVFRGGSGADTYIFSPGGGHDSIGDFTQGEDVMDLDAYSFTHFTDLDIVYGGSGTPSDPAFAVVVLDGGSSISVTLPGAGVLLTAADFLL